MSSPERNLFKYCMFFLLSLKGNQSYTTSQLNDASDVIKVSKTVVLPRQQPV
jgi:hypothetical protein